MSLPAQPEDAAVPAPAVAIEVRQGLEPLGEYRVDSACFLIGTAPGCDLQLRDTRLPLLLCMLERVPGGVCLRPLSSVPMLLDDGPATRSALRDGARLTIGSVTILVHIAAAPRSEAPAQQSPQRTEGVLVDTQSQPGRHGANGPLPGGQALSVTVSQDAQPGPDGALPAGPTAQDWLLDSVETELGRQRDELEHLRQQIFEDQARRGELLASMQTKLDESMRQCQAREAELRRQEEQAAQARGQEKRERDELQRRTAELTRLVKGLDDERRALHDREQTFLDNQRAARQELAVLKAELHQGEQACAAAVMQHEANVRKHEAEIERLDARQAELSEREGEVEQRAEALAEQQLILQRDITRLAKERLQLEEYQARVIDETQRLGQQKQEQEQKQTQLLQRQLSQEEREAALAALRLELEHQKKKLDGRERALDEQRLQLEHTSQRQQQELQAQGEEQAQAELVLEQQRTELAERAAALDARERRSAQERQQVAEQAARMEAVQAHVKQIQDHLADVREQLNRDLRACDARSDQVTRDRQQVDADRKDLQRRVDMLAQQEQGCAAREQQLAALADALTSRQALSDARTGAGQTALEGQAGEPEANAAPSSDNLLDFVRSHLPSQLAGPHRPRSPGPRSRPFAGAGARDDEPSILSLGGQAPADEALCELLQEMMLLDVDALAAHRSEARRRQSTLRQVLLDVGVITPFQLAEAEAGRCAALLQGSLLVMEHLRTTAHESFERVFDPRRRCQAVLRRLALRDDPRQADYRQRFERALLNEPNVAATLEVLDIGGRAAVLQELLVGLPATDWTQQAGSPFVCHRLLSDAARGLAAGHAAGLVHGHLQDAHLFLTVDGVLKVCDLGAPAWLHAGAAGATGADDLQALGRIASWWCGLQVRRGARTKAAPESLQALIKRLSGDAGRAYASAQELLHDLERCAADMPPNPEAWERLLKYVRAQSNRPAAPPLAA